MYELDITKKLHSEDDFVGCIHARSYDLYPNFDAASVMEASAYLTEIDDIQKEYKKNPENPTVSNKLQKLPALIFRAMKVLFSDEEYEKIKKMNLSMDGLMKLVGAVTELNRQYEEANSEKN